MRVSTGILFDCVCECVRVRELWHLQARVAHAELRLAPLGFSQKFPRKSRSSSQLSRVYSCVFVRIFVVRVQFVRVREVFTRTARVCVLQSIFTTSPISIAIFLYE